MLESQRKLYRVTGVVGFISTLLVVNSFLTGVLVLGFSDQFYEDILAGQAPVLLPTFEPRWLLTIPVLFLNIPFLVVPFFWRLVQMITIREEPGWLAPLASTCNRLAMVSGFVSIALWYFTQIYVPAATLRDTFLSVSLVFQQFFFMWMGLVLILNGRGAYVAHTLPRRIAWLLIGLGAMVLLIALLITPNEDFPAVRFIMPAFFGGIGDILMGAYFWIISHSTSKLNTEVLG